MSDPKKLLRGGREAVMKFEEIAIPQELSMPRKVAPNILQKSQKKSASQNVGLALRPHLEELLYYNETISDKKASRGLIDTLDAFRIYAKTLSHTDLIRTCGQILSPVLLPPLENDIQRQYMFPYETTNTEKNNMLINYLYSVINYNSAEESLYRGSGYARKNLKIV